jgi:undecaprenyl-diphosphatase
MDYRLEQWINGPAGDHASLDWIMRHISTWSEPAFIALIVVWFLIGWLKGLPRDRQGAITAAIAAGGALLVNLVIHSIWDRPRPFVAHPNTVHVLLSHVADASFPSDHASPSFAIAVALLFVHRRLGWLAVLGAVALGYARIYCGDHYPGDILAGAIVGTAVASLLSVWLAGFMAELRRLADRVIVAVRLPLTDRPPVADRAP